MMPLPQLLAELMLGIGGALLGANLVVLTRAKLGPRREEPAKKGKSTSAVKRRPPVPPSMTRVYINISIGAIVALWGLALLVGRR